jgi:hypothetical protein
MLMNDTMDMRGHLTLRVIDRAGNVVAERRHNNRIVKTGRQLVAQLFGGVSGGAPPGRVTHMAVGTNPTAPADAQTSLGAERSPRKEIVEVTYSEFDEAIGGGTVRRVRATLKTIFNFDEANDAVVPLREAGIFTAPTGGVMYNRVVFEPVTKTDAFQLTMLWDITF